MKNAWYILNYHDINWESGILNKKIGGTFSPDIFFNHLKVLNENFNLVSINEGLLKYQEGNIKEPILSIWFDDGLIGVRKYAYDILEDFKTKAAVSINSDFFLKKQMFFKGVKTPPFGFYLLEV